MNLALLVVLMLGMLAYCGVSVLVAGRLIYQPHAVVTATPAALGLAYRDVSFPSREDSVELHGWFIPGVLPDGAQTAERVIIVIHGARQNRADPAAGVLDLSGQLARHGFAVLAFDLRGHGASSKAPFSLGYFEQRDVLGAVDYLRSGPLPYPALGRPCGIGGWGVSMGANALLLAAARELELRAVVADSADPAVVPVLKREVPKETGLSPVFTPGILAAARLLYGVDFAAVRPVDVVACIAPRPLLFIQGGADSFNPPENLTMLATAAGATPDAHIASWRVPSAAHAQSYHTAPDEYVSWLVAFYAAAFGPASLV